jgi:hypothetical protein
MHLETHSFLGATVNPYNRSLTSGGSSGGEGALIGMRGSVLGSVDLFSLTTSADRPASAQTLVEVSETQLQ